jgi:hypothetical protein
MRITETRLRRIIRKMLLSEQERKAYKNKLIDMDPESWQPAWAQDTEYDAPSWDWGGAEDAMAYGDIGEVDEADEAGDDDSGDGDEK